MKRHLKIALDGAAKGVAVQYLATLAASICPSSNSPRALRAL